MDRLVILLIILCIAFAALQCISSLEKSKRTVTKTTVTSIWIGSKCGSHSDCGKGIQPPHTAYCDQEDTTCQCKDGYIPSENLKKCLPIAEHLNGPCEIDLQCHLSPSIGKLSKCDNQTRSCVCHDTKTPSNTLPDETYWDEETKQCKKASSYKEPLVILIFGGIVLKLFSL